VDPGSNWEVIKPDTVMKPKATWSKTNSAA